MCCFRAHVSAAPLKHGRFGDGIGVTAIRFRAHVSAAPLKQFVRQSSSHNQMGFRAHVSAAPLKLQILQKQLINLNLFPRSRERGPIEA